MADALLQNRRILVVEDEYMIAEAVSLGLRHSGATVLGPVSDVAGALALLEDEDNVDAAVLDINLGEQKVYPLVDVLLARGTRCVFATGNDPADIPRAYSLMTRCEKPVDPASLVHALTGNITSEEPDQQADSAASLNEIRDQLLRQIQVADGVGEALLAVKLCEALDAVDDVLQR